MTSSARALITVRAVCLGWLISGTIFALYMRDMGAFGLWLLWSMLFFIAGWVLVGLPLIAIGDEVLRCPYVLLALAGGVGAILALALPVIFLYTWPRLTIGRWGWYVVAAGVGALTTILYRVLLERHGPR
jgi:hypothetical protein